MSQKQSMKLSGRQRIGNLPLPSSENYSSESQLLPSPLPSEMKQSQFQSFDMGHPIPSEVSQRHSIHSENSVSDIQMKQIERSLPRINVIQHESMNQILNDRSKLNSSKTMEQDQNLLGGKKESKARVIPGYIKNIMDEIVSQFDYVKEEFKDDEIKEAFGILDLNKDGAITVEDLQFFLEFIGEKATQDELEEMIRMCDMDGGGEVRYDEFYRMARGQSLTPIGQAHPPTKELIERRNHLNTLMAEKELAQLVNQETGMLDSMKKTIKQFETFSPRFGSELPQDLQKNFQSTQGQKSRQVVGTNLKVIRAEDGEVDIQNKQQSQINMKDKMKFRKAGCQKFIKDSNIDINQVQQLAEKALQIEPGLILSCSYEEFLNFLQIEQNQKSNLLFNCLSEFPLREEQAKSLTMQQIDYKISLKEMLLTFLGCTEARTVERLEIAYQIQDMAVNGFIFVDELFKMLQYLYCLDDPSKLDAKVVKVLQKKGLKNQKDIIKKEIFINMINEYTQIFEI